MMYLAVCGDIDNASTARRTTLPAHMTYGRRMLFRYLFNGPLALEDNVDFRNPAAPLSGSVYIYEAENETDAGVVMTEDPYMHSVWKHFELYELPLVDGRWREVAQRPQGLSVSNRCYFCTYRSEKGTKAPTEEEQGPRGSALLMGGTTLYLRTWGEPVKQWPIRAFGLIASPDIAGAASSARTYVTDSELKGSGINTFSVPIATGRWVNITTL
jgi:uncharacterized protein YciI